MNDPGAHEPIQEAAEHVEHDAPDEREKLEEEEQAFLGPSRWWFASTACPLIAGTFGPMANAFSICALVENWRVFIPQGKDEGHGVNIKDPSWLPAINSVSLVFALIANLSLLLNMARRLSFAIAQPITIIGWYIASILLIVLVCLASSSIFRIPPAEEHALTQAFYYGIIAAALYAIIASLMTLTVVGAYRGHYPKDFRLTPSQRTLMLQTIFFMVYLLLGALVFSKIEGWEYLDGLFWADFTLLTIGLGGEFVPKSHLGRSLLIPFAIGGIVMVGLVIGSIRSLVLERAKEKLSARFFEAKRERVLGSIEQDKRTLRVGWFEKVTFSQKGLSETEKREQEFRVMRKIQAKAERDRRYFSLLMSIIATALLWLLGALVFMYSERPQGWSYFVALYFSYVSLLTIGYGDFTPSSNSGKPFFVFWSLCAIPTLTILISNMSDTVIKSFKDLTIWVGSVTVLPGEQGLTSALKLGVKRMGLLRWTKEDDRDDDRRNKSSFSTLDRLAQHVEEKELEEAEEAGEHGDPLQRDIHFYHYVLAKELRQLMKDIDASPPRQYTYDEWAYYLKLLGQDETNASAHRKPTLQYPKSKDDTPNLGIAAGGQEKAYKWSWLGIRSPLMGNKTEAQWLLDRLSLTLENEMKKMHSPDEGQRNEKPPISMADIKKSPDSDGDPADLLESELGAAEVRRRQQSRKRS